MGWICNLDTQGGTGFINDGHINSKEFVPLGQRISADRRNFTDPDVVIIDAGRNDGFALEDVTAAMSKYVRAVHTTWPDSELVMIVPYFMRSTTEPYNGELAKAMRAEMKRYGGSVVDPIADGWIGEKSFDMTIEDHAHPNAEGHRYIARHLVAAFKRLGINEKLSAAN